MTEPLTLDPGVIAAVVKQLMNNELEGFPSAFDRKIAKRVLTYESYANAYPKAEGQILPASVLAMNMADIEKAWKAELVRQRCFGFDTVVWRSHPAIHPSVSWEADKDHGIESGSMPALLYWRCAFCHSSELTVKP